MKPLVCCVVLLVAVLPLSARAQAAPDLTDFAQQLYRQANSPAAQERLRHDQFNAPEAYLEPLSQAGTLVLLGKRRVRVPRMRYNVARQLLEVEDSTGSHVWPPGSLDGFYLGRGTGERHFRSYKVRNGSTKLGYVEVLTVDDDSPVVLAVQHSYFHEDAQQDPILRTETRKARTEIGQTVVAGAGSTPQEPLRPLALNERSVLRLFGDKASAVAAYAQQHSLSYTDLTQVLRLVEYYNQRVVPKK